MDFFNIFSIVSLSLYGFAGEAALVSWLLLTSVYVLVDSIEGPLATRVAALFAVAGPMFYIGQPLVGAWCVVSGLLNAVLGSPG